ncbi:MAG: FtsK/SpoIIIE domain-containing protein, partial [Candidatus Dormibacteraceae bacterium]
LRWAWKKGHVWHLAWKVPPLLLASGMEKGKEVFEQGLDANCNIWAQSGLVHMRAGTAKLPTFLSYEEFYRHRPPSGELVFGVGWSKEGALWQDLVEAPHILSGGASGAGKTVFLRQAVTNLLLRYGPEQLKLVPIDLKRVEFNLFRDVPHLLPEIVVVLQLEYCDAALSSLSEELFRRLARLEEAGVENIQNWNSSNPTEKLAYVLVVIDEVAEVQRSAEAAGSPRASKAQLAKLARICCLGRAVGIHVMANTQRPDAEMVPGQVKAQMPVTVAFRCRGESNSKILLDSTSAAMLPPQPGLGIWQWDREVMFQSPYISKEEAKGLLDQAYPKPVIRLREEDEEQPPEEAAA